MWLVVITLGGAVLTNFGFREGIAGLVLPLMAMILLLAFRFFIQPLWIERDFRKHPNFQREQILRIDGGLHQASEAGQSDTKWFAYTSFRETQNLFVLYLGARLMYVVPKRALSDVQLQEFRQLLLSNVSQYGNTSDRGSTCVS
jgi:hypothetical protein